MGVAMPPMVSRHFNKLVTRICPNFTNLTTYKDYLVTLRHLTSMTTLGKDVWLKLPDKTTRRASHGVEKYISYIERTRQHMRKLGLSFANTRASKTSNTRNFNFLQGSLLDQLRARRAERAHTRRRDMIDYLEVLLLH